MGFKLSEYGGNYITAAEIAQQGKVGPLTISHAEEEQMQEFNTGAPITKMVVYFRETTRGWLANPKSAQVLGKAFGDDSDNLVGKQVILFTERTRWGNDSIICEPLMQPQAAPLPADNNLAPPPAQQTQPPPAARQVQQDVFQPQPGDPTPGDEKQIPF